METAWLIAATVAICAAVGLSAVALLRALIPPQQRDVRALRGELGELADEVDRTNDRITARAKVENTAKARAARDAARPRPDDLVEQAREIVASPPAAAAPAGDVEAVRQAYRRRFLHS